jgi:zinc transporter ZupT
MEASATTRGALGRAPAWLLALLPLLAIAVAVALFAALGGPGLGERSGPPVEELAIERTVLRPGEIALTVRNDGPDSVEIAQVAVNDGYAPFTADGARELGRLSSSTITIAYPWIEGEAYTVSMLTSTGGTIEHEIPVAAETPATDTGFFGLMALLGLYVGVIPVSLGLLWLPFIRRAGEGLLRALIAFTVGLLAFLAVDASIEGLEIAGAAPSAFGGAELVFLGALVAFLALSGIDAYLRERRARANSAGAGGYSLALMVAIGIGLHNLGEGLAIGSAYASGALALGAFLVVGFAIHNTTEGLAIVAPLGGERPGFGRLAGLGLIAGAPAILGAWIGAAAYNPSLAALLFGVGVGAIAQVVVQLLPSIRDERRRALNPRSVLGLVAGIVVLYATGLLVSV